VSTEISAAGRICEQVQQWGSEGLNIFVGQSGKLLLALASIVTLGSDDAVILSHE
jgi:hypothetical protein